MFIPCVSAFKLGGNKLIIVEHHFLASWGRAALILMILDGDSQNFLHKFFRLLETLRCFYGVVIHKK